MVILTPNEACKYLRMSRTTLWRMQKAGELDGTYYYINTRLFFVRDKLAEWAANKAERGAGA